MLKHAQRTMPEHSEAHLRQQIVDVENVQAALDTRLKQVSSDREPPHSDRRDNADLLERDDRTIMSRETAASRPPLADRFFDFLIG
jgi:hypothetical protein